MEYTRSICAEYLLVPYIGAVACPPPPPRWLSSRQLARVTTPPICRAGAPSYYPQSSGSLPLKQQRKVLTIIIPVQHSNYEVLWCLYTRTLPYEYCCILCLTRYRTSLPTSTTSSCNWLLMSVDAFSAPYLARYRVVGTCCKLTLTNSNSLYTKDVFGRVGTKVYRGYSLGKYSIPRSFSKVRYGLNTLPNIPVMFSANSIPVPDSSISSVRPQHQNSTLRQVRYDLNTYRYPTIRYVRVYRGYLVFTLPKWFGTASIPYRTLRYRSVRTRHRYPTLQ